ncbi:MAG: hypothetical protein ACRBC3_07090 [Burkholderiaceae bacterium]
MTPAALDSTYLFLPLCKIINDSNRLTYNVDCNYDVIVSLSYQERRYDVHRYFVAKLSGKYKKGYERKRNEFGFYPMPDESEGRRNKDQLYADLRSGAGAREIEQKYIRSQISFDDLEKVEEQGFANNISTIIDEAANQERYDVQRYFEPKLPWSKLDDYWWMQEEYGIRETPSSKIIRELREVILRDLNRGVSAETIESTSVPRNFKSRTDAFGKYDLAQLHYSIIKLANKTKRFDVQTYFRDKLDGEALKLYHARVLKGEFSMPKNQAKAVVSLDKHSDLRPKKATPQVRQSTRPKLVLVDYDSLLVEKRRAIDSSRNEVNRYNMLGNTIRAMNGNAMAAEMQVSWHQARVDALESEYSELERKAREQDRQVARSRVRRNSENAPRTQIGDSPKDVANRIAANGARERLKSNRTLAKIYRRQGNDRAAAQVEQLISLDKLALAKVDDGSFNRGGSQINADRIDDGTCSPLPPRCERASRKGQEFTDGIRTQGVLDSASAGVCAFMVTAEVNQYCASEYRALGKMSCVSQLEAQVRINETAIRQATRVAQTASINQLRLKCSWESSAQSVRFERPVRPVTSKLGNQHQGHITSDSINAGEDIRQSGRQSTPNGRHDSKCRHGPNAVKCF